jgi:6-phosphogluconolactonase/glucosamine-6-phosphate isomerase/deaminase
MSTTTPHQRAVLVHPDARVLAEAVAARLITRIVDRQSDHSPVHVVLTGGTVGIATLAAVAASPARDAVDWTGVHLWWGDERFLADGDKDRNETQARDALITALGDALLAALLRRGDESLVPASSTVVVVTHREEAIPSGTPVLRLLPGARTALEETT